MFIYSFLKKIKDAVVRFYTSHFYNYNKNIDVFYNFYTDEELVDEIVNNKKSIIRFGDGEFKLIFNKGIGFQNANEALSSELKESLGGKKSNIIVCIPKAINEIDCYTFKVQKFYKYYYFKYRKILNSIIPHNYKYGDSLISRFYIDYSDKSETINRIKNLKRIWDKKNILIVEGYDSKLGIGNDLFDNSLGIRRILVPNTNAYEKIDMIYKSVVKSVKKNEIVLLAVGPTATVLGYRLADENIQSIDIGHIDIEYEWFIRKSQEKEDIPGKNVNEVNKNIISQNEKFTTSDNSYVSQIIDRIK